MANRSILVVDEYPANLGRTQALLEKAGYTSHGAVDASDAIRFLSSEAPMPDLILLDIHLPGMDGLALATALKSEPATRGITIVAIAGYPLLDKVARATAAGCDDLIARPVSNRTLLAIVAYHLGRRSANKPTIPPPQADEPFHTGTVRPAN